MSVECGPALSSRRSVTSRASKPWRSWGSSRLRIATLEAGTTLLACPQAPTTRQQKQALTSCLQHLGLCKFLCSLSPLGRMPKTFFCNRLTCQGATKADDLSMNRLARFAHRPANRASALPALHKLEGASHSAPQRHHGAQNIWLQPPGMCDIWLASRPASESQYGLRQHRALAFCISHCGAFPPPEHLAATAEFAHKPQASENELMKVAALRVQQCPRIVCHCASSRRTCNPALKKGLLRLGLNRLLPGLPWEALKEGNISPLVLGAPQCPRKVPPSQATR